MKEKDLLTPMMKQFFSVKEQQPEALLLFRCGDFYETYGDDAVTASKVLGIVLTKRSNGAVSGEMPMAGFPHHAIEVYLPKLVRAGFKVAICDQLEDPKLTKNIVKRGITEVVTPGVVFNENLLEQKEHNYLAGICFSKNRCGAAFLDVSTGTFQVTEGSAEYVSTLIASFSPKEVLALKGTERDIRERFGENLFITSVEDWAFVYESARQRLCRQLGVDSLKGYAIDTYPLGVSAAGAVLVYLEQTQHAGLGNICSISRLDEGKFVWMDRFTLRNLEIFGSTASGEGVPLVSVMDKCASAMGSRLLRSYLAMPLMDTVELNARYDTVGHFISSRDDLEAVMDHIGSIGDLERIVSRAAAGKILPREVMQLGRGLAAMEPIREICSGKGAEALESIVSGLEDCSSVLNAIRRTMAQDPASAVGKGDVVGPGVSEELDSLREIARNGKKILLEIQQREIERTGISSLKISYNSVFGYYLEVRNSFKDKVPEEWIRKQTLVNAERYITAELKDYEEKILGAEEKIYVLESGIYAALVATIQKSIASIQKNSRIIAHLDVLGSFARCAIANRYCRPVVDDSDVIDIRQGRHPVIETLMSPGEEYVPNDIRLDGKDQQVIILTGPNMAGKSALLRQTALIVLMAQTGSFVPASQARIGYCDKIFTRVGASDNISRGESTFMVEMLETSMILHNLSTRSLVLLDEIGRGTSTYDGMSIARAIVEYIHEDGKGARTLFATHYHELNDMEDIYPRIKNFHIAVKEIGKKVIFLRKLVEGGVSHSFGIHVARMAGMPKKVLDSAEKTLDNLEKGKEPSAGRKIKPHNTKEGRVEADGTLQLSLFQLDDPLLLSLREDLENVDLNNLTPLQAFDLLRGMKEKLGI